MSDIVKRLRQAIKDYMAHQWSNTRPAMCASSELLDAADRAVLELERLRAEVDRLQQLAADNPGALHWKREAQKARDEVDRRRAERDALQADAERYREARMRGAVIYGLPYKWLSGEDLDAAIDSARNSK